MGVEDDDLSDLERRMRAKLLHKEGSHVVGALSADEQRVARKLIGAGWPNAHAFPDQEQRMAERLVGVDNAKRIASAKEGRRVRLAAVRVEYSWYEVPGSLHSLGGCRIERAENGLRKTYAEGVDFDELETKLADLRKAGHVVREVRMGFEGDRPAARTTAVGQRKSFADRYGASFRAPSNAGNRR